MTLEDVLIFNALFLCTFFGLQFCILYKRKGYRGETTAWSRAHDIIIIKFIVISVLLSLLLTCTLIPLRDEILIYDGWYLSIAFIFFNRLLVLNKFIKNIGKEFELHFGFFLEFMNQVVSPTVIFSFVFAIVLQTTFPSSGLVETIIMNIESVDYTLPPVTFWW